MDFFTSRLKNTLPWVHGWPNRITHSLKQPFYCLDTETAGEAHGGRLQLSAVGSLIAHIAIILGVGFTYQINQTEFENFNALRITLVDKFTDQAPKDAKTLAQANLDAGGTDGETTRNPTSPMGGFLSPDTIELDQLLAPHSPTETKQTQEWLHANADVAKPRHQQLTQEKLVNEGGENLQIQVSRAPEPIFTDGDVYERTGKREEFITGQTREYHYAKYMERWRKVVEYIGNLYYPEQAKRDRLSGDLVLDVAIRRDGVVQDIRVLRSSGHKVLDDSAVRIVRLAAPFQPFSAGFNEDIDILHITRTWEFSGEAQKLTTQ